MKIRLPNASEIDSTDRPSPTDEALHGFLLVEERRAALVTAARSTGEPFVHDLGDDEVVELTFEDNSRWFLGGTELAELQRRRPPPSRGDAPPTDEIVFDDSLFADGRSRGIIGSALRKLRVLLVELRDGLGETAAEAADEHARAPLGEQLRSRVIDPLAHGIARQLERRLIENGTSRLCRVGFAEGVAGAPTLELTTIDAFPEPDGERGPALLLLHGTLSSTQGSFGDLWSTRPADLARLRARFGERIYAFEHRTLTESPVDNALQIAKAFPSSIELHLLSHSRGGLVGELLCRGTRDGIDAFSPKEIGMFEVQRDATGEGMGVSPAVGTSLKHHYAEQLARLTELNDVLSERKLSVPRFVRVGCPARGTTLASGRLHRWSNRSLNAVGLITGQTLNPLYRAFESFTLGMLKANSKAEVLPGLQAQMPGSALIHVLNHGDTPVAADLAVVAGDLDAAGGLNWRRIPIWFTDRFYGGENDLVVNTASMDGGSARLNGIRALRVEGEHVNHFSYFANADSCTQLVSYLVEERTPRFRRVERRDDVSIPRGRKPEHRGRRPVLVIVPGILGSELRRGGKRIWAHPSRLLRGRITDLHIDALEVTATDVMERAYGEFIGEFSDTHDVHVAPYDWRRSLGDSAETLAELITGIAEAQAAANDLQPIRIVAHSMGGLVARTMMATRPETWSQVVARPGSRLIMAGTPTNGSYAINQIVSGELKLIKLLALADLRNTRRDITELTAAFPGVATMLPGFGEHEWLNESVWEDVKASASGEDWSAIAPALVNAARQERQRLLDTTLDPALVTYVAGRSERTVADAFFDPTREGRVCFRYTREGDGQVTWREGIPGNLTNVYYQPSVHGSLLAAPEHFDAWAELLDSGRTAQLPTEGPIFSGSRGEIEPDTIEAEPDLIDYLPDNGTLLELALGMEPSTARTSRPPESFRVRVVHGDLAFAEHPVTVGHYEGEPIVRAEEAIDRVLGRRLSERHLIGQYPGQIGTSAVVFAPANRDHPEGALIVGIGEIGELSAASLERSLTAGFINYLFEIRDWWSMRPDESGAPAGVKLTSLLIGTGIGSLSVHDSVGVVLRSALAANRACVQADVTNVRLIEELALIELWQDLALQAADSVESWSALMEEVDATGELIESHGGRQRSHFRASTDWWHSISVRQGETANEYVFDNYTRHARSELTREPIDRKFVDRFVDQIINTTRFDAGAVTSPQRALFELLLPRTIKERAPDSDKIRLILEQSTAHIPWEMLVDGWAPGDKPLVVSKQIIRRLSLEQFRNAPQPARGHRVLIVGDPPSGDDPYPALPGARTEATDVAEAFENRPRYEVTSFIADERTPEDGAAMALAIVESLYSKEFRILHFAAHGSYHRRGTGPHHDETEEEGMVIGEGLRLTPTLVSKMRKTPALVFLNCCHLGHVEQRPSGSTVRFNRIAANLATQFIRMGARAVVAAGWEVMDEPAAHFAGVFHEHMLGNATLAESIHAARIATYGKYRMCNTFGAYQCWGDPEFRLDPSGGPHRIDEGLIRYASPRSYALEAVNIRNEALSANESRRKALERKADRLLRSMIEQYGDPWMSPDSRESAWRSARVGALADLGRAFGELGNLPAAVRLLRVAYRLDASELSVKDLEQLASFECRYSTNLPTDRDAAGKELAAEFGAPEALLGSGLARLESVLDQHRASGRLYGQKDILCLVASGAKSEAMLLPKTHRARLRRALSRMRHYFGTGWSGEQIEPTETATIETYIRQAALNREEPEDYAFGNFALACIVLRWHQDPADPWPDAFVDLVRRYTASALAQRERAGDFWKATRGMESLMLPYLDTEIGERVGFPGDVKEPPEVIAMVSGHFADVNRRFGSVRQWATIEDHLAFVADMLDKKPDDRREPADEARREGIARITEVVRELKED